MALRQGQPSNICFYSNKCDWSEAFLKELSKTPYKSEFQFVCVDNTPRSQLPDWLKQVPTLMVRNDQEPIKTNSDVLNWLYERKMKDTSREPSGTNTLVSQTDEPEAWNISEMGGKLSESYGTLVNGSGAAVENSSSKNFDFGFLNGNAAPGIRTTQSMGDSNMKQEPGRQKSKKEELFNRELEAFQKNRDVGLPQKRTPPNGGRI
jgi:hypothetical protein